ncbi:MAG: enoyl-CoA hydratase-related protein [candidate division Zixibacteria bacterium]|nr:enoyl-CoA hydratase-related protein [candidate division Zixibacteria bacterium]
MDYQNILIEREEDIALVTVNRPKTLNSLDDATVAELQHGFEQIAQDEKIRAVVLTGSGNKSFIAGADINELKECDAISGRRKSFNGHRLLTLIESMDQIVIAAVNGFALGGGCEVAIACDIRIAADSAKLGQPEVNLGVIPGYGGTQRLPRLVGRGKAKEMILAGEAVDAAEALRIGLVDKVVPQAELLKTAKEMAQKIAAKAPLAIRAAKRAINLGLDVDLKSGCDYEIGEFAFICASKDKTEGTSAFLEKRKPNFSGK